MGYCLRPSLWLFLCCQLLVHRALPTCAFKLSNSGRSTSEAQNNQLQNRQATLHGVPGSQHPHAFNSLLRHLFPASEGRRRRRRHADEADEVGNVFDTPVGRALLDSLSNGYTREQGLGNGLGDKLTIGRRSPFAVIWPQGDDKMARRDAPTYDRGEPFSLVVRRALMDSLCYPGYGNVLRQELGSAGDLDVKGKKANRALRRLKRYLEIIRVKMQPGTPQITADSLERRNGGSDRQKRLPKTDEIPVVSRFLDPVPKQNQEFHTAVAQSKLHVGDDADLELVGKPDTTSGKQLPLSLFSSFNSLLSRLDSNLSNLLTVGPINSGGQVLPKKRRSSAELPRLGDGLDSLVVPLDTKKGRGRWEQSQGNAKASILHQVGDTDTEALKESHGGNLPGYKEELREVNQLLAQLLFELNRRKAQWAS